MQNNAKGALYRYVDELRNYLGISQSELPVNVIDLCHKEGSVDIMYHQFDTAGFCGAALVGNIKDTIILNSTRSEYEQNFDCGHEVVHLTKHRTQNSGVFNCFKNAQNSFFEWEANEGAAELIVPYKQLIPDLLDLFNPVTSSGDIFYAYAILSEKYRVSEMVMKNRNENLKYEIYQVASGGSINSISIMPKKQQEKAGICVPSCYEIGIEKSFLDLA